MKKVSISLLPQCKVADDEPCPKCNTQMTVIAAVRFNGYVAIPVYWCLNCNEGYVGGCINERQDR